MEWPVLEHLWQPALATLGVGATTWAAAKIRKKWIACREWLQQKGETIDEIPVLRKAADTLYDELHEQGAALRMLLANGVYGTFVCDLHGYNTDVNETYCRLIGTTRERLLGREWEAYVDPEERERYASEWEPAMETLREFTTDLTFTRSDGTPLKTLVRTVKLLNREGEVRGYSGFIMMDQPQPEPAPLRI